LANNFSNGRSLPFCEDGKPSALSGDKSANGELGLFEYVDGFNKEKKFLHEWMTEFGTAERSEAVKYFAMTFRAYKEIEAENKPHMVEMLKEIQEKVGTQFADRGPK
jgi:hypothetical protein